MASNVSNCGASIGLSIPQSRDGRSGVVGPGTTSDCFPAGTTGPGPHSSSLHLGFAKEEARVLGVLANFNFLHHFPEGGTITGPLITNDSDLLGVFTMLPQTRLEPKESAWKFSTILSHLPICLPYFFFLPVLQNPDPSSYPL